MKKNTPSRQVKCSACLKIYDKSIWNACPFCGSKLYKDYAIPNFYYELFKINKGGIKYAR